MTHHNLLRNVDCSYLPRSIKLVWTKWK